MKKVVTLLLVGLLVSVFVGGVGAKEVLRVGATPVPHSEVLEFVKPILAERGIELRVIVFNDYVQPNMALADGDLDANYFQHIPYLTTFSESRRLNLDYIAGVHIEPIGLYSKKISDISELKRGATIAIPNDPSNGGRALLLLEAHGLIKLKPNAGLQATPLDIVENRLNLRIRELDAAQLPRALADVDGAVINTNYALPAGLVPLKDALVIEGSDSPYVNVLAVRKNDVANASLLVLAEILTSKEVEAFILEKYQGAVVPAQYIKGE